MSEEQIKYQKKKERSIRAQEVGRRIRSIRNKLDMSGEELAEKSDISANYLYEIEKGEKTPSVIIFADICDALKVSIEGMLKPKISNELNDFINEISYDFYKLSDKKKELIKNNIHILANEEDESKK